MLFDRYQVFGGSKRGIHHPTEQNEAIKWGQTWLSILSVVSASRCFGLKEITAA